MAVKKGEASPEDEPYFSLIQTVRRDGLRIECGCRPDIILLTGETETTRSVTVPHRHRGAGTRHAGEDLTVEGSVRTNRRATSSGGAEENGVMLRGRLPLACTRLGGLLPREWWQ